MSFYSIAVPFIIGLWFFRIVHVTAKYLILYVVLTAFIEVLATVLFQYEINNLFTFHLHTFFEFGIFTIVYRRLMKNVNFRIFTFISTISFLIFSVISLGFLQDISQFNSYQRHLEAVLLIAYALFYLLHKSGAGDERWSLNPFAPLSAVILLYFFGNLFVFIFANQMFSSGNVTAWSIHGILNTVLNLTLAFTIVRSVVFGSRDK